MFPSMDADAVRASEPFVELMRREDAPAGGHDVSCLCDDCTAPTCDVCGRREEDTPGWEWNGDTGCHVACEDHVCFTDDTYCPLCGVS